MTLNEAIKLIQEDIDGNYYELDSPLEKAVRLGIEALKRIEDTRNSKHHGMKRLLPGEAKE